MNRQEAAIDFAIQHAPRKCVLCERQAEVFSAFLTDDTERFQAPPGKTRVIGYGLCDRHKPDARAVLLMVEIEIEKAISAGELWCCPLESAVRR